MNKNKLNNYIIRNQFVNIMFGLNTEFKSILDNIFNMSLFDTVKKNNSIFDTVKTTIILGSISYLIQIINNFISYDLNLKYIFSLKFLDIFYKKYVVEYEGKVSSGQNYYGELTQSCGFSDRFKALWEYIIINIGDNNTISSIKEYSLSYNINVTNNSMSNNIYMVIQKDKFLISKEHEIYAYTHINFENVEDDNDNKPKKTKKISKIEKINIELFSYKSNIETIKNFVEELTIKHLSTIKNLRENKKFMYTLTKNKYDDNSCELWSETHFVSTRTFNNLFFKEKEILIKNINYFLQNKEWYFEKGIPYSLGIGLHGPPGTGKTSLIKAIANYTNRHIIIISLKLIKTRKELYSIFFEDRYNFDNTKGSIDFDKKIIVFEDIDCIGDIVMDREKKNKSHTGLGNKLNIEELSTSSKINVGDLLETLIASEENMNSKKICNFPNILTDELPITLDDILNLWDGIRETPGRIMIISSNHYKNLDPALIRPGRIDITLELSYVNYQTIKEMYKHLFNEDIDETRLKDINENFYTPAEIINIYMSEERNPEKVINRLLMNKHV